MLQVVTGFTVIGAAILCGYVLGRKNLLGQHAGYVLSRLVFFLLSPALLFTVMAQADPRTLFSPLLAVSLLAAVVVALLGYLVPRYFWGAPKSEALMLAAASSQINSNNIGIPLSLYILGSTAYPAPVLLAQVLLFLPLLLTLLELLTRAPGQSIRKTVLHSLANPILLGSGLGIVVSLTGAQLPTLVGDPVQLLANAAIPVLLVNFGISLAERRSAAAIADRSMQRQNLLFAVFLKLLAMPLIAYLGGALIFRLDPQQLYIVTILAALPAAQNTFNYAQRYAVGFNLVRDVVALTTLGCVPVIAGLALLFG